MGVQETHPAQAALAAQQALARTAEIWEEFERLLRRPGVATRPNAKQWRFARHCLEVLLGLSSGDFPTTPARAAQYRFEVMQRFNRHYARAGTPPRYIFSLVHAAHAIHTETIESTYPVANSYVMLVREVLSEPGALVSGHPWRV